MPSLLHHRAEIRSVCAISVIAALVLGVSGCAPVPIGSLPAQSGTPAPSVPSKPLSYKPIDFAQWSSGMYPDKYAGQAVVADGYYMPNQLNVLTQGRSITFNVGSKSSAAWQRQIYQNMSRGPAAMSSPQYVTVNAPLALRDVIFGLTPDQHIRVYGRAANYVGGGALSVLTLDAERIEAL